MNNLLSGISGLAAVLTLQPASADTIYSGFLNTAIPLDFTGVTFTIDGGTINPFFGGVGVANNNLLQPFRDGTDNLDTLLNIIAGTTLDASTLSLSTGYGGSEDHVGSTFTAGQEGYIGFKLNGIDYGWMRVVFTDNTSGAVIKDWAYDDAGASLVVGAVRQESQDILLSSGFVLATQVVDSGGATNLIKSGAGTTTTLTGNNTYTGTTTVSSGTLALALAASLSNTSSVIVENGGTLSGVGTIGGATTIQSLGTHSAGNGIGVQTFSSGLSYNAGSIMNWELSQNIDGVGLNGIDYDGVNVSGHLSIAAGVMSNLIFNASGSTVNWNNAFWDSNHNWLVYGNATSSTLGSGAIFDTINVSNDSLNQSFSLTEGSFSWSQTGNDIYLQYTAIPEPSNVLLLSILFLFLVLRRHRKACSRSICSC